jgi:hypothetical protein
MYRKVFVFSLNLWMQNGSAKLQTHGPDRRVYAFVLVDEPSGRI